MHRDHEERQDGERGQERRASVTRAGRSGRLIAVSGPSAQDMRLLTGR